MKEWNTPEIVELDISSTERNNGNHYGWNNPHNPPHECHCHCHCDCCGNNDADMMS